MKVVTFNIAGERRVGMIDSDNQIHAFDLPLHRSDAGLLALIDLAVSDQPLPPCLAPMPLAQVTLEAPIPRPHRNIFCVGKNYFDHAEEFAGSGFDSSAASGSQPAAPIVFSKLPQCVIANHSTINIDPAISTMIDYEAELAVIIGQGGRNISLSNALRHVWGYTIINDVTARDLQKKHSQWLLGKSQDSFGPMGPCAVTADEIDLGNTTVQAWVNDELRQSSNTEQLIFDVPTLISTISRGITLMPGDIIATGTPAGVGIGFDPPKYLVDGDIVRINIGGIGELINPVRSLA